MSSARYTGRQSTGCVACREKRCVQGGLGCLRYGHHEPRAIIHRTDPHVPVSQSRPTIPVFPTRPTAAHSKPLLDSGGASDIGTDHYSVPSILGTGLRYMAIRPFPDGYHTLDTLEDFNYAWPQNQNHSTSQRRSPSHNPPSAENSLATTSVKHPRDYMIQFMESLYSSIPPSVVSTQTIGETQFIHMINEYQLYRVSCWFMPPPPQVRGPMINRLKSSKMTIWAVYLGLKLFKALNQNPYDTATSGYIGWIDKVEQRITVASNENSSFKDIADRLMAQLELTFIGFVTVGISLGYSLLRRALPKFHRLVAANPNLVVEHLDGNLLVSFPRTLGVPEQELNLFILYDAATAFALGVPHLVEYDYDGECDPTSHGHQCAHGAPIPLVEIISQVNSWRTGSKTVLDNWRALESRALAWRALPLPIEDDDASVNAGRLAVQESWRYVTLVYIYMGMCGCSSHDPRVQAAIAQIVRLEESVTDISISMHMLMHYVVVGLGARYEQQRSFIRERLLSFKGRRVWLFRGSEFSLVLDHLWNGVGAGGAPVTWDDYVRSRCAVLPI
ncbi:hypothetical protein OPQ81_003530 [Rhizoctonia solani]|nr:hypothetical protein OPQ81_003530 [Rhizoctonia solani]